MTPVDAAVVSTANGTWAMFWATLAAAGATLGAVIAAFTVQGNQFKHDRDEERRRVRATAVRAVAAISDAIGFVAAVEVKRSGKNDFEPANIWPLRGEGEVHLRTVQWHMSQHVEDERIIWCGQSAIQRLYETRAALDHPVKNPAGRTPEVLTPESNLMLKHAVERLGPISRKMDELRAAYPAQLSTSESI
jgi:hypothetical protein